MPELYTYPEITFVSPVNGETEIDLSTSIEVTFSAAMAFSEDEHSALGRVTDPRIFYVTRQVDKEQINVPGNVTYNPLTKKALFTPTDPLEANATYNITVVGFDMNRTLCAQDTRGNSLKISLYSTFHTKENDMGVPSPLYPVDKSQITGAVSMSWSQADSSLDYVLQVSPNNDFVLVVFTLDDTFTAEDGNITVTPNYAFTTGRYYWRVKQKNGTYSSPSQFYYTEQVEDIPPTPVQAGKPYIVSSYPARNSFNTLPLDVKVKFSEDLTSIDPVYGTDIYLVKDAWALPDLEDLDILPVDNIDGDIVVTGKVIKITPTAILDYGTKFSVLTTGKLSDDVLPFTTSFEFIASFIKDIQETISKYLNLDVNEIYAMANSIAEDAFDMIAATYTATNDEQYNVTTSDPPRKLIEYVMYKTEHNLLLQKYMDLTLTGSMKQLGDFTIETTTKPADMEKFIKLLRSLWQPLEDWLKGIAGRGEAKPVTAQFKGNPDDSTGYPDYLNRGL